MIHGPLESLWYTRDNDIWKISTLIKIKLILGLIVLFKVSIIDNMIFKKYLRVLNKTAVSFFLLFIYTIIIYI